MTNLRELGLGDTGVSDAGLTHLESLSHLTDLGLEETRVTADGVAGSRWSYQKLIYAGEVEGNVSAMIHNCTYHFTDSSQAGLAGINPLPPGNSEDALERDARKKPLCHRSW